MVLIISEFFSRNQIRKKKSKGHEVIKIFMFNSAEHEILNAKYKSNQEIQRFACSDKPRTLFFLLINVKMPTIVGILTFMSRENFILS